MLYSQGVPVGKFKKIRIQGVDYVMDHLEDLSLTIEECRTKVMFSCHCFTEEYKEGRTPDLTYRHKNEKRIFSIERHRLSEQLPPLISTLGNTSVYHTRKESFFFARTMEEKPYVVFFRAYKAESKDFHVIVNVESAYPKQNMTDFGAPVKFPTVIRCAAQGRTPPTGRPVQIKRK